MYKKWTSAPMIFISLLALSGIEEKNNGKLQLVALSEKTNVEWPFPIPF